MKAAWMPVRIMVAAAVLCVGVALAHAADAGVSSRGGLRAKYAELRSPLSNNPFRKPNRS